jgi:hypothetical protein
MTMGWRRILVVGCLLAISLISVSGQANALGEGSDSGCCQNLTNSVLAREPAMVQARGLELFEKLKREPHSQLVLLEALDESVCIELAEECRGLEPAIVQRLIKIARETQRQDAENSWQSWNYVTSAINTLLALAACAISFFAYRASRK